MYEMMRNLNNFSTRDDFIPTTISIIIVSESNPSLEERVGVGEERRENPSHLHFVTSYIGTSS
jgi:hypothetical protein